MCIRDRPLYFGKWWSENKVREIEFIAPIKASFSLAAYLVYYILLIIIGCMIGQQWFWLLLLAIPIVGFYALLFYDFKASFEQRRRWAMLDKAKQEELITLRTSILSFCDEMLKSL